LRREERAIYTVALKPVAPLQPISSTDNGERATTKPTNALRDVSLFLGRSNENYIHRCWIAKRFSQVLFDSILGGEVELLEELWGYTNRLELSEVIVGVGKFRIHFDVLLTRLLLRDSYFRGLSSLDT
jgi:hypothetical protein